MATGPQPRVMTTHALSGHQNAHRRTSTALSPTSEHKQQRHAALASMYALYVQKLAKRRVAPHITGGIWYSGSAAADRLEHSGARREGRRPSAEATATGQEGLRR
uniref:Uncharacterized protein n=1 Tax=Aegilops tauschii TaxID=37682 RepID=N1QPU3_AEGTA